MVLLPHHRANTRGGIYLSAENKEATRIPPNVQIIKAGEFRFQDNRLWICDTPRFTQDPMPSRAPTPTFFYPPVDKRLIKVGFYLTTIGSLHYSSKSPYPVDQHPDGYRFSWEKGRILHDFTLILIERGSGMFECSSVPLTPVKAGQFIWLMPGEWHRYRPDPTTGWDERWIGLSGFHLHQLRKSTIIPDRSALLPEIEPGHLESTVLMHEGLLREVGAAPGTNHSLWSTRALGMLLHFFEEAPSLQNRRSHLLTDDLLVNLALTHIRDNCHRQLTVDWVAARCQVGRRSLERHFAATGRQSVAKEILASRIERAEFLLRESPLPIKEVAYACGFATPQRMIYSFRRQFGCTPGSLREA
jgi:AraC-like DNA-binding protein